jgi:hypothetical protein
LRPAEAVMLAVRATIAVWAMTAGCDRLVATIASVVVAASTSTLPGIAINEVFSTIWRLPVSRATFQLSFSLQCRPSQADPWISGLLQGQCTPDDRLRSLS